MLELEPLSSGTVAVRVPRVAGANTDRFVLSCPQPGVSGRPRAQVGDATGVASGPFALQLTRTCIAALANRHRASVSLLKVGGLLMCVWQKPGSGSFAQNTE